MICLNTDTLFHSNPTNVKDAQTVLNAALLKLSESDSAMQLSNPKDVLTAANVSECARTMQKKLFMTGLNHLKNINIK